MNRNQTKSESGDRVCVGRITGAHGVGGAVRIESFTADPADVAAYGAVISDNGDSFNLRVERCVKQGVVAWISGIDDRTAAERLKNTALYVSRDALPAAAADEWYHADLVGCRADTPTGGRLGEVVAVRDFGAGTLLEIKPDAPDGADTLLVPFTHAAVPVVEITGRRVVIDPPDGLLEPPPS